MGVAGLVAALAGRPARRWYALLLAAAATLALNPRAAGEPGWQLSFAAVAALLVGAAPLEAALARRMPEPVADAPAITVAATLGTAPLMALHFEQLSLGGAAREPARRAGDRAGDVARGARGRRRRRWRAPLAPPFSALTAPLLVYLQRVAHVDRARRRSRRSSSTSPPAVIVAAWAALLGAPRALRVGASRGARGAGHACSARGAGAAASATARRVGVARRRGRRRRVAASLPRSAGATRRRRRRRRRASSWSRSWTSGRATRR